MTATNKIHGRDAMHCVSTKDGEPIKTIDDRRDAMHCVSTKPTPLQYTTVMVSEVIANGHRLDAGAFNLAAKTARTRVEQCQYGYVTLDKLIGEAYVRGRFKRIYTERENGIPFYQPASITDVYPKPDRYISENTDVDIDALRVWKGMLLMTVSGTIGKCSIVGDTLDGKVFSHDLLRLYGKGKYDTGYIYAYLSSPTGQQMLQTNNYGAVIQHIEPEHLKNVIIPDAPEALKRKIHELVVESYDLRDQSNALIDEAERTLLDELHLPPHPDVETQCIASLQEDNGLGDVPQGLRCFTVRSTDLNLRLDGSYHLPVISAISKAIHKQAGRVATLGDKSIVKDIILAGRFKRTYVESDHGIPFFGGKQLLELNPSNMKYLSTDQHNARLEKELLLKENMIAVTCSGTIGRVNIVPKHWEGWALNQHVMRIVAASDDLAGYIYCWLNTDYGYRLITRYTYGSVIDEIDDTHLSQIEIPLLKDKKKQQEINDKVLQANALRYEAYRKEQYAIKQIDNIIHGRDAMHCVSTLKTE